MEKREEFRERIEELGKREWDDEAIKARVEKFIKEGVPKKDISKETLQANKEQILDSVQRKAEEYNYIFKNCSQGTALALLDEFGLGNKEVIRSLTLFPGIGGTGDMCGGVTGSLIAFGLYFFGENPYDFKRVNDAMFIAQKFIAFFEDEVGYYYCSDIMENVIFGQNMSPGASEENMSSFASAKGFEKCGLMPGIGARLAAEFMIDEADLRAEK